MDVIASPPAHSAKEKKKLICIYVKKNFYRVLIKEVIFVSVVLGYTIPIYAFCMGPLYTVKFSDEIGIYMYYI